MTNILKNIRNKLEDFLQNEYSVSWSVERLEDSFSCKWNKENKLILQYDVGKWYITSNDVPADIVMRVYEIAQAELEKAKTLSGEYEYEYENR